MLAILFGFLIAIGAAILLTGAAMFVNWIVMGIAYLIEICFKGIH